MQAIQTNNAKDSNAPNINVIEISRENNIDLLTNTNKTTSNNVSPLEIVDESDQSKTTD
jgi:peptide subunit release factor RF-3